MACAHCIGPSLSAPRSNTREPVGAFKPTYPVDWMLTVLLEFIHASSRELATGRLPEDKAEPALIASITGALAPPAEGQAHREAVIAWLAAIPGFVSP